MTDHTLTERMSTPSRYRRNGLHGFQLRATHERLVEILGENKIPPVSNYIPALAGIMFHSGHDVHLELCEICDSNMSHYIIEMIGYAYDLVACTDCAFRLFNHRKKGDVWIVPKKEVQVYTESFLTVEDAHRARRGRMLLGFHTSPIAMSKSGLFEFDLWPNV